MSNILRIEISKYKLNQSFEDKLKAAVNKSIWNKSPFIVSKEPLSKSKKSWN